MKKWIQNIYTNGFNILNYGLINLFTLIINKYGSRLLKINIDNIISKNIPDENKFFFNPLTFKELNYPLGLNLLYIYQCKITDLIISAPWNNPAIITISHISIQSNLIKLDENAQCSLDENSQCSLDENSQRSLDISISKSGKSYFDQNKNLNDNLLVIFLEIKQLLSDYIKEIDLHIDLLDLVFNDYIISIHNLNYQNNILSIDKIIIDDSELLSLIYQNNSLTIKSISFDINVFDKFPIIYIDNSKSIISFNILIETIKINDLLTHDLNIIIDNTILINLNEIIIKNSKINNLSLILKDNQLTFQKELNIITNNIYDILFYSKLNISSKIINDNKTDLLIYNLNINYNDNNILINDIIINDEINLNLIIKANKSKLKGNIKITFNPLTFIFENTDVINLMPLINIIREILNSNSSSNSNSNSLYINIKKSIIKELYNNTKILFDIFNINLCIDKKVATNIDLELIIDNIPILNIKAKEISKKIMDINILNIFIDPLSYEKINNLFITETKEDININTKKINLEQSISYSNFNEMEKDLKTINNLKELIIENYENEFIQKDYFNLNIKNANITLILDKPLIKINLSNFYLIKIKKEEKYDVDLIKVSETNTYKKIQKVNYKIRIERGNVIDLTINNKWSNLITFDNINIIKLDLIIYSNTLCINLKIAPIKINLREELINQILKYKQKTNENNYYIEYFSINDVKLNLTYYPKKLEIIGTEILNVKDLNIILKEQKIYKKNLDEFILILVNNWINDINILQIITNIKILKPLKKLKYLNPEYMYQILQHLINHFFIKK